MNDSPDQSGRDNGTLKSAEDKLSREDLDRVAHYLRSPIHQVERKPFRPWLMMLSLVAVVILLSLLSLFISWLVL